jgi:hypothetical protein
MYVSDAEAQTKPDFSVGKYVTLMGLLIRVKMCE